MPQFDVHRNRGQNRKSIPFVVVVQSSLYDEYGRRVVVPLVRKESLDAVSNPRFNPTFVIKNIPVVLHPLEIVSISKTKLGTLAGSLKKDSDRIIDALDELITRGWG